jgi:iron-sulfur cluster assembly accessory protein
MDQQRGKADPSPPPTSVPAERQSPAPFALTEVAVATLRKLLSRSLLKAAAVRIEAGPAGGATDYRLGLDDARRPEDTVVESDGMQFRLDAATAERLRGTTIDYVDALHGSGFIFTPGGSEQTGDGDAAD